MRKGSLLVALSLVVLAATARAEEGAGAPAAVAAAGPAANANVVPAAEASPAAETHRNLHLGVSFLPTALGKFKYSDSFTSTTTQDAYFAYGVGLSATYESRSGLYLGFAPQAIFNVQPKPTDDGASTKAMREFDFMARLGYVHRLVDTISAYVELMPGYSLIVPADNGRISKGLVVGVGVGCVVDMTERYFVNVGAGYQVGYQSQTAGVHKLELRTEYVRVALGAGARF
jgi:hypothetical protein